MCGIAGIWNRNGKPVERETLEGMNSSMAHRGRDGSGTFTDGDLGLAHVRMSIIDLSEGGHQPMSTADGHYHINFNGEIHNYIELRKELESAGYFFHSHCDTEVALAAYVTWGENCFNRFNGMWAIAIWDSSRRELILCRDRFGIKPLVYSIRGTRLAFASEAKSILHAFPIEREPDFAQVYGYIKAGVTDIDRTTFFQNIKSMPPGTVMKITADSISEHKFWNFKPGSELSRQDAEEEFRRLLIDATRIRLRSDAPMAVWLSGGLDSSVITRITRSLVQEPLECYSLRYENWHYDESAYAVSVANEPDHYRMHWVTPDRSRLFDTIDQIVTHHDAPPPARGRYAMWHIAEETARHQKVVLTGDGSDELFGGYGIFMVPYLYDRLRRLGPPRPGKHSALTELSHLALVRPQHSFDLMKNLITPLLYRAGIESASRGMITTNDFNRKHRYLDTSEYQAGWAHRKLPRPYRSALNNALWHEFTRRGLPEILHGFDALSMAHTIESRSPFLDHRVVEFCFSLSYDEKIRDGFTKSLLRRSFSDMLPPDVRDRRNKFGFQSPVSEWLLQDDSFKTLSERLLDGECVRNSLFDKTKLASQLNKAKSGKIKNAGAQAWQWLCMENWYRTFISCR